MNDTIISTKNINYIISQTHIWQNRQLTKKYVIFLHFLKHFALSRLGKLHEQLKLYDEESTFSKLIKECVRAYYHLFNDGNDIDTQNYNITTEINSYLTPVFILKKKKTFRQGGDMTSFTGILALHGTKSTKQVNNILTNLKFLHLKMLEKRDKRWTKQIVVYLLKYNSNLSILEPWFESPDYHAWILSRLTAYSVFQLLK